MVTRAPLVVVVAGPNGGGKSTMADRLLRDALAVSEFVNADPIARGLSGLRPSSMAMAAGRLMLARVQGLAKARRDFAFETTLASRSFAPWLARLRRTGYWMHIAFLALPDADLAVARVAARVREGGHDVDEAVVRRRFTSGLKNFFGLYQGLADGWEMFDNSGMEGPRVVATGGIGRPTEVLDSSVWRHIVEQGR